MYILLSLLFFLSLLGWTAFTIINIRSHNIKKGEDFFSRSKDTIYASYLVDGRFDSPYFLSSIESLLKNEYSASMAAIWSIHGMEYLYSRNSSELPIPLTEAPTVKNKPDYEIQPLREVLFSSSLFIPTAGPFELDLVYKILSQNEVLSVMRKTLYALIGFLVFTIFYLILMQTARHSREPQPDIKQKEQDNTLGPLTAPLEKESTADTTTPQGQGKPIKGLFSPRSGLGWEEYLEERLNAELSRSAAFDQDLSCVALDCSNNCSDSVYKTIAQMVIDSFSFQDMTFEHGLFGFIILLPNTDLDQAIIKTEDFIKKVEESSIHFALHAGISSRNGRLLRSSLILKETFRALEKAKTEKDNRIVAFRTDPSRYRQFIASQG